MTEALPTAIADAEEEVAAVADPVERYHQARIIRAQLIAADHRLKAVQQAVAVGLKAGRTWAQVGEALGVTGSRAEALAKGR